MPAWVYVFDMLKPLSMDPDVAFRLVRENPLKLFVLVRDVVGEYVGSIEHVNIHGMYFSTHEPEFVVEYMVKCVHGEVSVKIIYSEDPVKALAKYYKHEKEGL